VRTLLQERLPIQKGNLGFPDRMGSETTQPMKIKFCTIDYVGELSPHA